MPTTKTEPTGVNVDEYLASRAGPELFADCKTIAGLRRRYPGND